MHSLGPETEKPVDPELKEGLEPNGSLELKDSPAQPAWSYSGLRVNLGRHFR
jgi:hypothetical protein